jgi:ATP-dependent Lon protease
VFIPFDHQENFRIRSVGVGNYCGFTITDNERFLLEDWTVTHNTAIAKTLSKCLDLPFSQVSFGGVTTPEFLLGHDYTYIGSRPGEITRCLSRMGTKNGILFFDEFDKASDRKEIMSTLLHITDFSQNNEFRDNYFPEFCQDLSTIWFIYSMNELPKDPAMLDRLDIIKVDGYTFLEKKIIAKEYIFPKFANELYLQGKFTIEENALNKLVGMDNSEGVRKLERSINLLMEKIYFFIHNDANYQYEWFTKMKRDHVVINEELIDLILKV